MEQADSEKNESDGLESATLIRAIKGTHINFMGIWAIICRSTYRYRYYSDYIWYVFPYTLAKIF